MLGLRRYKNIQIDLWQGDIKTFATDRTVDVSAVNQSLAPEDLKKTYCGFFETSDFQKLRHISVPVSGTALAVAAETAFQAIKDFIDYAAPKVLRRVTFVAADDKIYDVLQQHLFARFPDELDEKGY